MNKEYNNIELLDWYIWAGVEETCADFPDLYAKQQNIDIITKDNINEINNKNIQQLISTNIEEINNNLKNINTIKELNDYLLSFNNCTLKKTACNTILGDGNLDANIFIIGDVPSVDDDKQGKIFAGVNGAFFEKMLKSINIDKNNCYISYILPWRPPGNRKATKEELDICIQFIKKQIEIINPDFILLLGGLSLNLINVSTESISKERGKWITYKTDKEIYTLATYHPSFILQNTSNKPKLWADLIRFKKKVDELK